MQELHGLWAVAVAEMRSARRLVRTWLFIVLCVLLSLITYAYYSGIHGLVSGLSASVGLVNPRFILSSMGVLLLWVMIVAIVFLAFDVRARDARERIADVLDARPLGNLTLLGGRLAGLALVAWLALVVAMLAVQGLGAVAVALEWPFGDMVEPYSMAVFLFVDAPPALILWCSLVILLSVLARNRLIVAVVALALLGAQAWWVMASMPAHLSSALAGVSSFTLGSDVLPRFAQGADFAQRACQLLLAGGFLVVAAALHPRPDHRAKVPPLAAGAIAAVLAVAGVAALAHAANSAVGQREEWRAAHDAVHAGKYPRVDRVDGRVVIEPGQRLTARFGYRLDVEGVEDALLFTLNPGMSVTRLRVDGQDADFEHENGLLRVSGLPPASTLRLSLVIDGVPDPAFAYLDSAIDVATIAGGAVLPLLGSEASIFDERYVALMPGVFWMPTPGPATGRDEPHRYGRDFFLVDLEVEVPEDWLVAGPGRREGENGSFRFRPPAPLPEVALFASRFERVAAQVADVELELLSSPVHRRNIDLFADVGEELQEQLRELLDGAANLGLPYPYAALSAVETPAHLRTFGGGWAMESVQSLPGVLLLREGGFPTARFEFQFRNEDELQREGNVAEFKVNALRDFFQNDVTGGNPLHGSVRNFLGFSTGATGPGAFALDFVVNDLAVQLLTGSRSGFFSPYLLASQEAFGQTVAQSMASFFQGSATTIGGSVYMSSTRRPSVWGRALGTALVDLDPQQDPRLTLDVLWLKGPEVAQAVLDGLGREKVAALLAELRRRHVNGNYDAHDFAEAASAVGADLDAVLGDWLNSSALPGFVVSPVQVERLADDEQGQPRYQIRVHVRNEEPVPGLVRLSYGEWHGEAIGWVSDATPPTRIPAQTTVELGVVAVRPPAQVRLAPYLALNRAPLDLPLPEVDEATVVSTAPFTGGRASEWRPPAQPGIVVDDLEPGFAVRIDESERGVRLVSNTSPADVPGVEIDEGLPVFGLVPLPGWQRQEMADGWGKYRRTIARAYAGDGDATAVFSAQLPAAGRWRLEYHLPPIRTFRGFVGIGGEGAEARVNRVLDDGTQGAYDMRIRDARGDETAVSFDGAAAEQGWNRLGVYDLPAGDVELMVSNETDGEYVVADAIRWISVES